MKAILSGERRTLVCLIFWLAGSFTAGPFSDVSGERDLAARVALVAPNPVWPRSSALDARLEKETGLDEADQLGDERRLRSMSFFEAIAGNDEDTFCKMLNEGMDPNVELPTPVPIAFQKRFTDGRLRYYLSKDEGFTALMLATVLGNDRFVKILLSAGADPWKETKRHKTFALWLAAKYKNIEVDVRSRAEAKTADIERDLVKKLKSTGQRIASMSHGDACLLQPSLQTGRPGLVASAGVSFHQPDAPTRDPCPRRH